MNINSAGPNAFKPVSTNTSSALPKAVQSFVGQTGIAEVLSAFKINPQNIKSLSEVKGLPESVQSNFESVQTIPLSDTLIQILGQLGLENVVLAIALSETDQIKKIRKKLNQIAQTYLDPETKAAIFSSLDLPDSTEGILLITQDGGYSVIENALNELRS